MNRRLYCRKSLVFAAGAILALPISCSHQEDARFPQSAAQAEENTAGQSPDPGLMQDVATLKDKAADQAHSMMDVDYHFTNLWFAGKAENWPLAEFYWNETRSHMHWAVRIIPVRKDNAGQEVKLLGILEAIENTPSMQVGEAIKEKDVEKFEAVYRSLLEGCYTCHKASDKPYLRPQVPERPATAIINFDPNATWPK